MTHRRLTTTPIACFDSVHRSQSRLHRKKQKLSFLCIADDCATQFLQVFFLFGVWNRSNLLRLGARVINNLIGIFNSNVFFDFFFSLTTRTSHTQSFQSSHGLLLGSSSQQQRLHHTRVIDDRIPHSIRSSSAKRKCWRCSFAVGRGGKIISFLPCSTLSMVLIWHAAHKAQEDFPTHFLDKECVLGRKFDPRPR